MSTLQPYKHMRLGGAIALLSGLWGVVIAFIYVASQVRMISPGTPIYIVLQGEGKGFLFLALHLGAFAMLAVVGGLVIRDREINRFWAPRLIVLSIIFVALSLIPGSSLGFLMLPAALGMLTSGLLLNNKTE